MRIRSPRDFWAGLLFVGIAALFIALASQYRFGEAHRMGPGYFPIMVGALLAILGAVVAGARARVRRARRCRVSIRARCW